jgi:hypothetical protein
LGVRRGFAELFRAYSSGFVIWLDSRPLAGASTLDGIVRELARRPAGPVPDRAALHRVVEDVTGRTLGATDLARDLEAEWAAFLRSGARGGR